MGHCYAAMVFVNVMWGLSFILSKHAMTAGFPSMTLAFLRYVVATALLIPMAYVREINREFLDIVDRRSTR